MKIREILFLVFVLSVCVLSAADNVPGRVGLVIGMANSGQVVVQSVAPASPAQQAGIKAGDIIMEINGTEAEGHSAEELARMISGPAGTDVTLLIWHPSQRTNEKLVLKRVQDFSNSTPQAPAKANLSATASATPHAAPQIAAQKPAATGSADAQRFQRFSIIDSAGTGKEAYRMLVPAGWKGDGRILWDLERKSGPASLAIRVTSPDGTEEADYLPPMIFSWSPMLEQVMSGRRYLGTEIVRPINGPVVGLRQLVIPRYYPQLRNYNVLAAEELPKLAQAAAPMYQQQGLQPMVRAGRVRIEYPVAGNIMQEEITCIFMYLTSPAGALWTLDQITSFRAPREKFEQHQSLFRTMTFSIKPNVQWFNDYQQATQILMQGFYQDQAAIMQRAQIEHQKNEAISATIMQQYESRQSAMERIHENYDTKAVRGVQLHVNPFDGSTEEIPDEYEHAWVNALGEHIYTNQSSYNPNVGSNLDWREMPDKN